MREPSIEWSDVIFVNGRGEILLNLRDDKPDILYPNCWDFVGGTLESGETADECLVREVREETGQELGAYARFSVDDITLQDGRVARSYTYYAFLNKDASELTLGEGQEHRFFGPSELDTMQIVPLTERVLRAFLSSREYKRCQRRGGSA